jgi:hypothetical protein
MRRRKNSYSDMMGKSDEKKNHLEDLGVDAKNI